MCETMRWTYANYVGVVVCSRLTVLDKSLSYVLSWHPVVK
jgi:hypothetical protein